MEKYYIAYGSNLNYIQMQIRCPKAKIMGTTMLEGWELLFKGSKTGSYLTIEPKEGSKVPVAIWKITEEHERTLDLYEGFPNFYYKKEIEVTMNSGRKINAFAYIMHEERPIGLPSKDYVRTCHTGYEYFGFNKEFFHKAVEESERRMYHEEKR